MALEGESGSFGDDRTGHTEWVHPRLEAPEAPLNTTLGSLRRARLLSGRKGPGGVTPKHAALEMGVKTRLFLR